MRQVAQRDAVVVDRGVPALPATAPSPARRFSARLRAASRSETAVARLAIAVVALHIADDNFLQPQRGTSAGDHVVSGLAPIALLIGTAAILPHLRAGLRAATAIVVGIFAAAIGAGEAGYYSVAV